MAVTRNSGSKSTTWEGIEGYVPDWIKKDSLQTKLNPIREKQTQQMMSKEDFKKQYGFIYGDDIDKVYQDAVTAKYDEIDGQTRLARDTSLQDMASGHDQYLQTMREQKAGGTQSGIMKGANLASEMSAMFGSQAVNSESQQGYATNMAKLANERGTAAEEARINAMKDKNSVANQMGVLGLEKYGYDVQDEASYLSYMGQENANIAAMLQAAGVWNQAEGQNKRRKTSEASSWDSSYDDSADVAAAASRYSADRNYAAGQNANAAGSKLYDDAVASYKKLGYSDADARLKAMQLDNTAAPKDFTSDANSGAAPKANKYKPAGTKSSGGGTYDSSGNWEDTKHNIYGGR